MILNNNKLKSSLLIKKFQTGRKYDFDPYAGLYTTVKSESSSTNQVPQNIRNLQEKQNIVKNKEDQEAEKIKKEKEEKAKKAKKEADLQKMLKDRRENPDMMTGISETELKANLDFQDKIDNPTFIDRVDEFSRMPARYFTSPISALGDFDAYKHGSTKLPNTIEQRKVDLAIKYGPGYLTKDQLKDLDTKKAEEYKDIFRGAALQVATLGTFKGYKFLKGLKRGFNFSKKKPLFTLLGVQGAVQAGQEVVGGANDYLENDGKTTFTSFADWKEKPSWARNLKMSSSNMPKYGK